MQVSLILRQRPRPKPAGRDLIGVIRGRTRALPACDRTLQSTSASIPAPQHLRSSDDRRHKGDDAPPEPANLTAIPLNGFGHPLARTLGELAAFANPIRLRGGQMLFDLGDRADYLFLVSSGALRSCRYLPDGRRHIGSFFLGGDCIGIGIADAYPFGAEAVTESALQRYPRREFDRLLTSRPMLGQAVLLATSESLIRAHERMFALGRNSAEARLAAFLLSLSARLGNGDHVHLPMPRIDIAYYLGVSGETVSRAFAHLRAKRLIAAHGRRDVRLLDRDRLAALARVRSAGR
jgi:CRP/FNR family nitrogen fixation transcriptional regulator